MALCFIRWMQHGIEAVIKFVFMKKIIGLILIALLAVGGVVGWFAYSNILAPNVVAEQSEIRIDIPSNAELYTVTALLKPYLKNEASFERVAGWKKYRPKGGRYTLQSGWSNNDLINHLRRGTGEEVSVIFNNIDNIYELAGRISVQIEADSAGLVAAFLDKDFLKDNKLTEEKVQMIFIPNTYRLYWNTTAESFRNRMLREYRAFWNADRMAKAEALNMTPTEVSTLASIVQKETVKLDERPRVAGLYINRLQNNWKLQSDPTVIYALRRDNNFTEPIKRVLYKDLEVDSPYNTYMHKGLPPAPICITDISALDAVLDHEKHSYFYMCASVERFGYHEFAKTNAQHSRNKAKYVAWLRKNKIRR